jgi:enoyl-CoA hydratase
MNHEGHAQLYVRLTTENFEESVRARSEGRKPIFRDQRSYEHELDPE